MLHWPHHEHISARRNKPRVRNSVRLKGTHQALISGGLQRREHGSLSHLHAPNQAGQLARRRLAVRTQGGRAAEQRLARLVGRALRKEVAAWPWQHKG